MIPGQNILKMALSVIAKQTVLYYKFAGRSLNAVGQDVTTYSSPFVIVGSFQPVPKRLYAQYGLDFQKSYYTFYTSNPILDVERKVSADQIAYNGQRFQCESNTDWFSIDGWKGVLCVFLGQDTGNKSIFGFSANNQNFGNGAFASAET